MSLHITYALTTLLCACAFLWALRRARKTDLPYPPRYPWITPSQRKLELFTLNQAGRIALVLIPVIWLVQTAAYIAINLKFVSE
ncbi:hypothetical protein [Sphingomonas sp. UNC305MFCol5.2]|uniref:hypothetical protein n=1 Tax=Sphingomonas sp. UNC305MFCol5.2 TaxID=1449076 RepID=UPI00040F38F7|nr:hypothetical protein [Sphingomonas sp. UNC305MFCol5.2]